VFQRVEAMRIGGDDLVEMRFANDLRFLSRRISNSRLRPPTGVVSGVALAFVENPEVETGSVKNARRRGKSRLLARIVRGIVAHDTGTGRAPGGILDGKVQLLGHLGRSPGLSNGIPVHGSGLQRFLESIFPYHPFPTRPGASDRRAGVKFFVHKKCEGSSADQ